MPAWEQTMDHDHHRATRIHSRERLRLSACTVTIGAFDGVHGGHRALIRAAVDSALPLGVPSVAYTFDPPPKALVCGAAPRTSTEEKIARIGAPGVDPIVVAQGTGRPAADRNPVHVVMAPASPAHAFKGGENA